MKIILPGDPIAQIRMKYSGRNGIGRIYDPREKAKREIKSIISTQYGNHTLFNHPRVSFIFHMSIPKSTPKKFLPLFKSGFLKHEKKPDTDNLLKLYLDCMDPIVFDGDQKVQLGPCIKLYHPEPKTIIIIEEKEPILQPNEVDHLTWLALFSQEFGKSSSFEMDCPRDYENQNHLNPLQSLDNSCHIENTPLFEKLSLALEELQPILRAYKQSHLPA